MNESTPVPEDQLPSGNHSLARLRQLIAGLDGVQYCEDELADEEIVARACDALLDQQSKKARLLALMGLLSNGQASYFWFWRPSEDALWLDKKPLVLFDDRAAKCLSGWATLVDDEGVAAIGMATAKTAAESSELSVMIKVRTLGGQWRPVEWRALVSSRCEDGRPLELMGVLRDLQNEQLAKQLSEAQAQLAAAEKSKREKNLFLGNVSHDIRTPLNAILGLASLAGTTALSREQAEYMRLIRTSAESVVGILSNVLDFSRIEAGGLELDAVDFSPRRMFADTLRALSFEAQQKGLEVILDISPDVPHSIRGDATRIKQILTNLFQNATKFTAAGEISVAVGGRFQASKLVLSMTVKDTGSGIPEAALGKIFEAYCQADSSIVRQYGGAGLGLSICRRLAELMQGSLKVESVVGQGSSFSAEILCVASESACWPAPATDSLEGQTAIVICANANQSRVLTSGLEELGANVATVCDLNAAAAHLQMARNSERAVDWVFADFPLLLAATGEQLATIRKGRAKGLLALTGVQESIDELSPASRCCVDGAILKPLSSLDIIDALSLVRDSDSYLAPPDFDVNGVMEPQQTKKRVLIAEDNPVSRHVTAMLLDKAGYQVNAVADGKEAVDYLEQNRSATDLVVMDLQMPRLDGIAATQAIRMHEMRRSWVMDVNWSQLPILGLTGDVTADTLRRCMDAGMTRVLTKPVRPDTLIEVIGDMIRQKALGNGPDQQQMGEMAKLIQSQIDPGQVFGAKRLPLQPLVLDETLVDPGRAWFGWDTTAVEKTARDFLATLDEILPPLRLALQKDDSLGFGAAMDRLKGALGLIHADAALQAADELVAVRAAGNAVQTDERLIALLGELSSVANELRTVGEEPAFHDDPQDSSQ